VRLLGRGAAVCFVLAGILLGVVHRLDATAAEGGGEGVAASVAYGCAIGAPGLVALLCRGPLLVAAAGLAGGAVAFLASFGATLPLLLPALALLATGIDAVDGPQPAGRIVRAAIVVVAIPWAALVLVLHDDPVVWATGASSDVVVWWEAGLSLVLSTGAVALSRVR
jgi:putative intracellular protease/amidase